MSRPFFAEVKVEDATPSRRRVGRAERSLSELRRGEANPVEICTTFALSWFLVLQWSCLKAYATFFAFDLLLLRDSFSL